MTPVKLAAIREALKQAQRALWNEWHDKPVIGKEAVVALIDEALRLLDAEEGRARNPPTKTPLPRGA